MSEQIVSWTTPFLRAERAVHEAGEHFEFHRYQKGVEALKAAQADLDRAMQFVKDHHLQEERHVDSSR